MLSDAKPGEIKAEEESQHKNERSDDYIKGEQAMASSSMVSDKVANVKNEKSGKGANPILPFGLKPEATKNLDFSEIPPKEEKKYAEKSSLVPEEPSDRIQQKLQSSLQTSNV